ncbi:DUF6128 domain-containing protein [Acetatifactor muris]|uniref:DUF6128 domain-containing protein n=1 Tax=Acetatifactor muris TaxID=879566 RepID=UPI0023F26A09|nr:DUF6128 domain-containing protein [Acetatifactor muris]
MLYDRKIKYLDYYENGERVRGGGFAKLEVRDGSMRLELKVTGLHPTDSFDREVMLRGNKKEKTLGSMAIVGGKGQYLHLCHDIEDIGGTGISYEELEGIRIPLGAGREISCVLQQQSRTSERRAGSRERADTGREERVGTGREERADTGREERVGTGMEESFQARNGSSEAETRENFTHRGTEVSGYGKERERTQAAEIREESQGRNPEYKPQEVPEKREEEQKGEREEAAEVWIEKRQRARENRWRDQRRSEQAKWTEERRNEQEKRTEEQRNEQAEWTEKRRNEREKGESELTGVSRQTGNRETEKPIQQKEDKWAQLWEIYPHIHPFQDEREYLSIRPSDFVLFPAASYRMVNNSFLLHGYYNYHHLLLGRVEKRGENFYYIGVPGNFYEREKQVAIMFGFESFECAEEPAQAGDFGYYMMRTEL